jgi:4,5-dihydroxyphthalate decarboxylase
MTTRISILALTHDWLSPLRCGDIEMQGGVELMIDHSSPIEDFVTGSPHHAGEMSLARMLLRGARGDDRFVPIPIFVYRAFVHREFIVRRSSTITSFEELRGRRIGLMGWPNTGNTWARAVMRAEGTPPEEADWFVTDVSDPDQERLHVSPPAYVRRTTRHPIELLRAGEAEAIISGVTPPEVRRTDGDLRRLHSDFPQLEKDYFVRTGIYPAHHILGVRRDVFEQHPPVLATLFDACTSARRRWYEQRLDLEETTPWIAADIDACAALFPDSWYEDGLSAASNQAMLAALHAEQVTEGLAEEAFDPVSVFKEFEATYDDYATGTR